MKMINWMKHNKVFLITVLIFAAFFTTAPMTSGTLSSKTFKIFDAVLITTTGSSTSSTYTLEDSKYLGLGYIQTGNNPSINLTYDQSFDGINWITNVGTVTSAFTSTSASGGSLSVPVAPLIRFKVTGTGANGTSTFTCWGMKQ